MQKYVIYFEEEYTPCGNWLKFFFNQDWLHSYGHKLLTSIHSKFISFYGKWTTALQAKKASVFS